MTSTLVVLITLTVFVYLTGTKKLHILHKYVLNYNYWWSVESYSMYYRYKLQFDYRTAITRAPRKILIYIYLFFIYFYLPISNNFHTISDPVTRDWQQHLEPHFQMVNSLYLNKCNIIMIWKFSIMYKKFKPVF